MKPSYLIPTFVTALAIGLPALASAERIRASYEGTISEVLGDGFGYSVGDAISGWFEFDTSDFSVLGSELYSEADIESDLSATVEVYSPILCVDLTRISDDDFKGINRFSIQECSHESSGSVESEISYELDASLLPNSFGLAAILAGPLVLDNSGGKELSGELYEFSYDTGSNTELFYNSVEFGVSVITFEIVAPTAQETLSDLVSLVMTVNTQAGISNALDGKLSAALNATDDANQSNDGAALNAIYALCSSVDAQRDKQISASGADDLISAANKVIASIDEFAPVCL